jgi:hypothetical protein
LQGFDSVCLYSAHQVQALQTSITQSQNTLVHYYIGVNIAVYRPGSVY